MGSKIIKNKDNKMNLIGQGKGGCGAALASRGPAPVTKKQVFPFESGRGQPGLGRGGFLSCLHIRRCKLKILSHPVKKCRQNEHASRVGLVSPPLNLLHLILSFFKIISSVYMSCVRVCAS